MQSEPQHAAPPLVGFVPYAEARRRAEDAFIKAYVGELLGVTKGNIARAAHFAKLDRSNFKRLMKRVSVVAVRPTWNGLCLANQHGLDFEGQACDLCLDVPLSPESQRKLDEGLQAAREGRIVDWPDGPDVIGAGIGHKPVSADARLRAKAPRMEHVTRKEERRDDGHCHAASQRSDGECNWKSCPVKGKEEVCPRITQHNAHGRESAEDYPNASHCPCVGIASSAVVHDCADAGCRYCKHFTEC